MYEDMLSDRQKIILKAIVEEYVDTGEPVGSKALIEKPYLNFSSATIRNDMQYLESIGLLEKTHTSSGRRPSAEGYRYYVSHLITIDYDIQNEFPLIDKVLTDPTKDRKDMIQSAINLLSDLTKYMTFAGENHYDRSRVSRIDVIKMSEERALLIIVTTEAKIESRQIRIPESGFDELAKVIKAFDKALQGKYISDIMYILETEGLNDIVKDYIDYQDDLKETIMKAFQSFDNFEVIRSDMDNLFEIPEFQDLRKMRGIVKRIEQEELRKTLEAPSDGLQIQIGSDNLGFNDVTIISMPYYLDDEEIGTIAVIGPKRMEYRRVIPLLQYLTKNLNKKKR